MRPADRAAGRPLAALARVYVSAAEVIVLDEATCHLDPAAVARAEQALAATGRTLIVIAHRVSSARRAQRILLLDGSCATAGTHSHHQAAAQWFDVQTDDLILCRVTQMSLLRLLSNPAIMGDDALTRSAAWRVIDQLWADEPAELEAVWRAFSARDDKSHKLWTDDYLAAFAQTSDASLATLDAKLQERYPSIRVEPLI